jgi:hypothetical protein
MTRFLQAAKDVIVAASANPLALAALLLLLVTWLVVALKVNRNKELLKNLNKLPNRDRLKALQAEMGVVQIKGGLSPEQWLRNKVRTYYLVALAMLCVTVIVLIAIIVNSHAAALKSGASVTLNTPREDLLTSSSRSVSPKPPSPVSPERPPSPKTYRPLRQTSGTTIPSILRAVQVTNTDSPRLAGEWDIPPERTVTYASDLRDGLPEIRFRLPYHDMLARGGPVSTSPRLSFGPSGCRAARACVTGRPFQSH